jgi:hypothetical protein
MEQGAHMAQVFIEGNEAIARGALRAGCSFFSSYPITPASTILHYMMQFVPEAGGTALQAEDEIAAIGFCIGASMAGAKALTATSGPGISLYSENIGVHLGRPADHRPESRDRRRGVRADLPGLQSGGEVSDARVSPHEQ